MRRNIIKLLVIAAIATYTARNFWLNSYTGVSKKQEQHLEELAQANNLNKPYIVVDKSDSRLYFVSNKKKFSFYVGLSKKKGKKESEGDQKMPEGLYYVSGSHRSTNYHYFIGISYPNSDDAKRGLESKLIDQKEYDQILADNNSSNLPPQHTNLGGLIGIHGSEIFSIKAIRFNIGPLYDLPIVPIPDISEGCIRAKNYNIDKLRMEAPECTPILIME